ncbi:XRE family transcriptional regulator [Aestuariibius sp. 2305UL40-4]|uniref:XRE family transcriptional regulator n=1 Tax=Aestuariibius violaceus TaxID=3234132 RepID=UPI00345EF68C
MLVENPNAEGVTQQQLADRLHRSYSYKVKIETGERRLDVELVEWGIATELETGQVLDAVAEAVRRSGES